VSESVLFIECVQCGAVLPPPLAETKGESLVAALIGNQLQCPDCRMLTSCRPANMFHRDREGNLHALSG